LHFYLSWRGAWCGDPGRRVSWCPTLLQSHGRPFVGHRDGFISNRDQPHGGAAAKRRPEEGAEASGGGVSRAVERWWARGCRPGDQVSSWWCTTSWWRDVCPLMCYTSGGYHPIAR